MVDRQFVDPDLAGLYEALHPAAQRADFAFYLPLVMAARAVLDVGCGTGELLRRARQAGHTGYLCGLDPADAMLTRARTHSEINWVLGDLTTIPWDRQFDLVIMTGHAFQVLLEDDEIRASLSAVRSVLTEDGHFVFETRNPLVRAWESWTPDHIIDAITTNGAVVSMAHEIEPPGPADRISFTTTFTSTDWEGPQVSRSTLRFLSAPSVTDFLSDAGLEVEEQFGDWDRHAFTDTSPENIVVARQSRQI